MVQCCVRVLFLFITVLLIQQLHLISSYTIGVNHGFNGDNLPPPAQVVDLFQKCQIQAIRIFEPRQDMLEALRGKPLLVSLGTRNEDTQALAQDPNAALAWVNTNVVPYIHDVNIGYITVSNEKIPGPEAPFIAQAINNIVNALTAAGIKQNIKVTTVVSTAALAVSYPPSAGAFADEAADSLKQIAPILTQHGWPIMINVYPHFALAGDPEHVSLDYALFRSTDPVVVDGEYNYFNLFDAMVDAFHAAFEKIGAPNLAIDVSESGWPTAGNDPYTNVKNANTYNKNLLSHVSGGRGTPRRPGQSFNTFFFEMFDEDLKTPGIEQNWGFFFPNMAPIYPFWQC